MNIEELISKNEDRLSEVNMYIIAVLTVKKKTKNQIDLSVIEQKINELEIEKNLITSFIKDLKKCS
jgi:hypothetical protein